MSTGYSIVRSLHYSILSALFYYNNINNKGKKVKCTHISLHRHHKKVKLKIQRYTDTDTYMHTQQKSNLLFNETENEINSQAKSQAQTKKAKCICKMKALTHRMLISYAHTHRYIQRCIKIQIYGALLGNYNGL